MPKHSGQINKKNKQTLRNLVNLMKDLDQKYSIKVGIIGEDAGAKHSGTGLTNAELGAIHEFGATINVTDKMRNYLHYNGMHLKPETTTVVIPTRSFLRMPLLSGEFMNYLNQKIGLYDKSDFGGGKQGAQDAREMNLDQAILKMQKEPKIMERIANWVGAQALIRVQDAFNTSGFGKWAAISPYTAEHRKGSASNPPLDDTGELKDSISVQVKKVE